MKRIFKTILAVSIFTCLTAASSTAQTVPSRTSDAAYVVGNLGMLLSFQKYCGWNHDHQGGLR